MQLSCIAVMIKSELQFSLQKQERSSRHPSAWAEEYQAGPSQALIGSLSLRDSSHAPSSWAADFLGNGGPTSHHPHSNISHSGPGSQWAEEFRDARPNSEQWADEFVTGGAQVTPASETAVASVEELHLVLERWVLANVEQRKLVCSDTIAA